MHDRCPGCWQQIDVIFDPLHRGHVFIQHVHPQRTSLSESDERRWCEFSGRPANPDTTAGESTN